MRRPGPFLGLVLFVATSAFVSCSDSGDDSLVRACRVVVETCHRGPSVGQCLDELGPLAVDCLGCIGAHQCDYAVCQSDVAGCRLPLDLIDPRDRIDVGTRPPDAGSQPADSGSGG